MIRKLLAVVVLSVLTAAAAYAQKPVVCAVTDIQDDPTNGLAMCRSLFIEYFLSELTTHAKVNVLDTRTVQNAIGALKFEHGKKLTPKEIGELCDKLKCSALCLVAMKREKNGKMIASVELVDKTGKVLGNVSAQMDGVGDTDAISSKLARDSAIIIRKINGTVLAGNEIDNGTNSIYNALPSTVTNIYDAETK